MTRSLRPLVGLLIACLAIPAGAAAQTVDEIIERAVAARGGPEQVRAFRSERLIGSISFNNSPPNPFVVEIEQPGKMRNKILVQGKTVAYSTQTISLIIHSNLKEMKKP